MMENQRSFNGPYRATRLWNEAIRTFRNGMPTTRHWKQFRSYDNCFSATEAVDWLHEKLKQNPHFGPDVTRQQIIQLLLKFYKAGVLESVKENDKEEFKEGGNLYRLSNKSPFRNLRTPGRAPLAPLNNQNQCSSPQFRPPRDPLRPSNLKEKLQNPPDGVGHMAIKVKVTLEASQLAEIWKGCAIERLEHLTHSSAFGVPWLKHEEISPLWVMYNVTCIGPRGVVRPPDCDDSPPKWVLYGMKALTNWPNYESPLMPTYKGSEVDVFKVITDFFCTSEEPLVLYQLYEAFTSAYRYVDRLQKPPKPQMPNRSLYTSVEDLLSKMSNSSSFALNSTPAEYSDVANYVTLPRKPRKSVSTPEIRRQAGFQDADLSSICFETAFANEIPETRIIPKSTFRIPKTGTENRGPVKQSNYGLSVVQDRGLLSQENRVPVTQERSVLPGRAVFNQEFINRGFSSVRSPMAQNDFLPLDPAKVSSEGFKREKSLNFFRRSVRRKSGRTTRTEELQELCQNSSGGYVNLGALESSGESRDYVNVGDASGWMAEGASQCSSSIDYGAAPSTVPLKRKNDWNSRGDLEQSSRIQDRTMDRQSVYSLASHVNVPLNEQLRRLFVSTFSLDLTSDRHNDGSSLSNCSGIPSSRMSSKARIVPTDSVLQQAPVDPHVLRIDLYRLLSLLLPPSDRRKLHLLLRFMSKVATNHNLILKENVSNKDFMVATFHRCILRTQSEHEYDECLAQRVTFFLMDNVEAIMTIPPEVCSAVQKKIGDYQAAQQQQQKTDEIMVPISYCLQVSPNSYEMKKKDEVNDALSKLLDQIVNDPKMPARDKKKRLKQFREAHPAIYFQHFPNGEDAVFLSPKKTAKASLKAKMKSGRI